MPVMIQIRNVPDDVHRKLKKRAAAAGTSLSEFLLREAKAAADRMTMEEWLARLHRQKPINLGEPAAAIIRRMRDSR